MSHPQIERRAGNTDGGLHTRWYVGDGIVASSLSVCFMRAEACAHADHEVRDQKGRLGGAKPGLRPLISGELSLIRHVDG